MWIVAGNLNAKLQNASAKETAWVEDYLTFSDSKSFWSGGDGQTCLLNSFTQSFPSGLVPLVRNAAKEAGMQVQVIDQRTKPTGPDPNADIAWLRDYQDEAVRKVGKVTRGILWHPTGSGKGDTIVALTKYLPCNWLFLVHRMNLAEDIAERYQRLTGAEAGLIGDGQWALGDGEGKAGSLTCATMQSLSAAMKHKPARFTELVRWAQAVVIDEAHTLPAASFWKVVQSFKNAYYRVAASGTPLARGDRRSLYTIAATGPIIHRVKTELLVERGILARPTIRMLHCYQESPAMTWQGAYGDLVVRSTKRNRLITAAAVKAQKPALVFVKELKHGQHLVKRLGKAGLRTEFVWGKTKSRKQAINRLVRGDTDVIVCSVVFQEGADIPELASAIIGSGGKSTIATLQRIGRAMRNNQGQKQECEIYDIADVGNKWMERHARARRNAYIKEGHKVIDVQVPQSAQVAPAVSR